MTTRFIIYLTLLASYAMLGIIVNKRKKLPEPFRAIPFYFILILVTEIIAHMFSRIWHNNFPPFHFLSCLQLLFFGYFYLKSFPSKFKTIIFSYSLICLSLCLMNSLFFQDLWSFPTNSIATVSLMAISLSLFHFKSMLENPQPTPLYKEPMFWINTAHLLFFGATFFIWVFFNTGGDGYFWVYYLIFTFNIIMYSAYFLALVLQIDPKDDQ